MRRLILAAALVAGCSGTGTGFGVDVLLTLDGSVSAAEAARIKTVALTIGGAESGNRVVPGGFVDGKASISYKPTVQSGTLSFAATAEDGSGATVASGMASVALKSGKTVSVTVTLAGKSAPFDGGAGDGGSGPDMGQCGSVTTCVGGDGCCPSGCNPGTDSDCTIACGNGVVETGEVCDDGNTNNGDACDPTCQWTNDVTVVSGKAGGNGLSGKAAALGRLYRPRGIATDGTYLYVAEGSGMIRKVDPAAGTATVVAGAPFVTTKPIDGAAAAATFSADIMDVEYLGGALYVTDSDAGNVFADGNNTFDLRKINLAGGTVSAVATIPGSNSLVNNRVAGLATDGTMLYVLVHTLNPALHCLGGPCKPATRLWAYNPSNGTGAYADNAATGFVSNDVTILAGAAYATGSVGTYKLTPLNATSAFASINAAITGDGITNSGGNLIITDETDQKIVSMTTAGVISGTAVAGSGTIGGADSMTPAMATFDLSGPSGITLIGSTYYVVDSVNATIRSIAAAGVTTPFGAHANVANATGSATTSTYSNTTPVAAGGLVTDGTTLWMAQPTFGIRPVTLADGSSAAAIATGPVALTLLDGKLYGSLANGTIVQMTTAGASQTTLAGVAGTSTPPRDGCAVSAGCATQVAIMAPAAITSDGTDLYFVDNGRLIRKLTVASGAISTLAGFANAADVVDGTGAMAHFGAPQGLVYTGGALYTLDGALGGNDTVVRKVDVMTGAVTTLAGQVGGIGGNDGIGAAARFTGATDLATDGKSLFILDAPPLPLIGGVLSAPAIRQLELATNRVTTLAGVRGTWTSQPGVGVQALVNQPSAITYDGTKHALYFFDSAEGVVERIQ